MGSEGRRLDPLAEAFADAADSYDRARPGYEDEPLDWAFRELGLDAGSVVLDLAAGTGKLSRALAPRAGLLIAVEPLPGMRRVLAARAPEATLLDGTAEQIPMGDGSVDAVFVGEAFHWFDGARALPEIHRVLRPAGGLALLWHHVSWRDRASWADEFEARLREVPAPHVRPENRPHTLRWQEAFAGNVLFAPLEHREFSHPITIDAEQIVQLVLSWSFVAALPKADRELLARDLSRIVHNHAGDAQLELPFVTWVYLTRKH
jgi:SAM-dependent methyltransferase